MLIALAALAVNVGLKVALFQPLGAVGLAVATSVGFWVNLAALVGVALSRETLHFDALFAKVLAATGGASLVLAGVALFGRAPALALGAHFGALANLVALIALGTLGALAYFGVLAGALRLLGVSLRSLRGAGRAKPDRA